MKKFTILLIVFLVGGLSISSAMAGKKNKHGSTCKSYNTPPGDMNTILPIWDGMMNNGGGDGHMVICPIEHEMEDDRQMHYKMRVYNPSGKSTQCNVYHVRNNGNFHYLTGKTTTTAGSHEMTTGWANHYSDGDTSVICWLPEGGKVHGVGSHF